MGRKLHCVVALIIILVVVEAYLQWEFHAASRTTLVPAWKPLQTIEEKELSRDKFYTEYVLKKRPVIIRLAQPDRWNKTQALENCGEQTATHISGASYNVLRAARHWWWIRIPFEWIFLPILGMWTTLDEQLNIRMNVPLNSYMSYADQQDAKRGQTFSLGLPLFMIRSIPMKLLLMLDYFKRPRYLHDIPMSKVCDSALDWLHVPKYVTPNWWFLGFAPGMDEANERQYLDEPTMFIGKGYSASYGLHQNIRSDFDFFLMVLEGQKRYALYNPTRKNINSLYVWPDMNVPLYVANPFDPDLVATPKLVDAKGWMGYLKAGEVLYSPGESIHTFENADFEKPTVAVKFWAADHTKICGEGTKENDCKKYFGEKGMPKAFNHTNGADAPTIRQYIRDGLRKRARESVKLQEEAKKQEEVKLPAGWTTAVDPQSGHTYFLNSATGEAQWELPEDSGQAEL